MAFTYAGRYFDALLDSNGFLIKSQVFGLFTDVNTTIAATLYTDSSKTQTMTTAPVSDSGGNLEIYADPGVYFLKNLATSIIRKINIYEDVRETANESELSAELLLRQNGDTAALNNANSYTDSQIATRARLVENVNVVSASTAACTLPDVTNYTLHDVTLTANCTFAFPAPAAGKSFVVRARQDAIGSRTATWPASVKWAGGTAPTLSTGANKIDILAFTSFDGSTYDGMTAGFDFR